MHRRWTTRFLFLCFFWTVVSIGLLTDAFWVHGTELSAAQRAVSSPATDGPTAPRPGERVEQTAPQKAFDLLAQLQQRDGKPLPGDVGGREFRNRERRLPRGRYREYDVNRKIPGQARDAERIVIEQRTGKAYYTGDHYRTFIPLN
jgi:ribonuclease T1